MIAEGTPETDVNIYSPLSKFFSKSTAALQDITFTLKAMWDDLRTTVPNLNVTVFFPPPTLCSKYIKDLLSGVVKTQQTGFLLTIFSC